MPQALSPAGRHWTMVEAQKYVVVTGASSGIGLGTVRVLIQAGYHVCGSVRRPADGERLVTEFGESFTPLLFDVTDQAAVKKAAEKVRELLGGKTLFGLVNNAGVAFHGPLMHQPIAEFARNVEINLTGTLIAFLPLLGADRTLTGPPGRIIMVSSIGGKFAAPFIGAYAASKHGLEGLSESLRRELMLFGIDVIVVGPGAVVTPIWDKAEAQDISAYDNTPYKDALAKFAKIMLDDGRSGHSPEHIGRGIEKALTARRPSVRYAIVANKFQRWTLPLLLPVRWVDWLMASTLGLLYKKPAKKLVQTNGKKE
ncbi:short-chain dehydrogenase/reductase SDR [Coccomyxa subellipsoidea C-169]|uniref:Short-chain dehydrogenase/reductase SDR n=1 Tax=Coccomyxa subellipsoidea (strain C-169) TaxID=574566 RepID=I0YX44_COCSC|nr:short-chain dehydrogenase/reductase SDR [Coccomyxa subellipsoidea C-169]EIE22963.1 short-chain dehydrogenase/reductase SDR [Coccomyxa subellipsoidea C-169]|eukprot:XP_005647507.1 short-chain dehydrogenase/reductase SDR [Coccomyxa subellipsoidea C-169]